MSDSANATGEEAVDVIMLGTTSNGGHCPTMFAIRQDDEHLILQGDLVTDERVLVQIREAYAGIGEGEAVVKIPKALLAFAPNDNK